MLLTHWAIVNSFISLYIHTITSPTEINRINMFLLNQFEVMEISC